MPDPVRELHKVMKDLERLEREANHAPRVPFVREVVLPPLVITEGGGET